MKKYKFIINGNNYEAEILNVEDQVISLELNGTPFAVTVDKELKAPAAPVKKPATAPSAAALAATAEVKPAAAPAAGSGVASEIKSPLPGAILDIYVKVGDAVAIGQKVMLLEAMKMENNIEAEKAGVVREIKVSKGDAVMEGDLLIILG